MLCTCLNAQKTELMRLRATMKKLQPIENKRQSDISVWKKGQGMTVLRPWLQRRMFNDGASPVAERRSKSHLILCLSLLLA